MLMLLPRKMRSKKNKIAWGKCKRRKARKSGLFLKNLTNLFKYNTLGVEHAGKFSKSLDLKNAHSPPKGLNVQIFFKIYIYAPVDKLCITMHNIPAKGF